VNGAASFAISFTGRVTTGKGAAVGFTSSAWARDGFIRLVGIDPFPGTLNLTVAEGPERDAWRRLQGGSGILMAAHDPASCDAVLFPVTLNGREPGVVVLPKVPGYDAGQVEIIAPVHLRGALGLRDGDSVVVRAVPVGGA
jgi:CTP-dependent riboflavin kinase